MGVYVVMVALYELSTSAGGRETMERCRLLRHVDGKGVKVEFGGRQESVECVCRV